MARSLGSGLRVSAFVALIIGAVCVGLRGQTNGSGERFTANAVNLDSGGTSTLEIVIDRWSTEAEHDRLLGVLQQKGPDKLLDALQSNLMVGYIRDVSAGGVRWELRYARRVALPDGGERVIVATDRPIGVREEISGSRTLEYPFTIIQFTIQPNGEGEGKLSAAARVTFERKTNSVVVENWGTTPILLQNVKRDAA
jgi:hypothetical protein